MPPNPAPGINPVALTYHPPNHSSTTTSTTPPSPPSKPPTLSSQPKPTGSTSKSIPHPEPVSQITHHIAGILTTIYGLAELPASCSDVAVLWLLHPRLQTQECMMPFAAHIISSWNDGRGKRSKKGLIAVGFDQRNHGTREVSAIANEAWRSGNEQHAQDMFSCYAGTAVDTSMLIDYLPGYIFPSSERRIVQHMVLGISLGGHAAWHVVMQDARVSSACVVIGCPDYERLMADRARLSKRKTWVDTSGEGFVGSKDFPRSLVESVRRVDPAGVVFGALREGGRRKEQEHIYDSLNVEEKGRLAPLMARCFGNTRIMCLSGGSDKLVPHRMAEPFVEWLQRASGKGGFFESGGLVFEDVVFDGVGHEVPPQMVDYMIRFATESLESGSEMVVSKRGSRDSRM